jgi:glycogen synthase
MSNYDPVIHDLERALDKLRQDRDDWKELAEKAIAQIEEWRALCDIYQERYNQIVRGN